uniref:Immunoglobulin domain-containing protein n=1 Tax=Pundamilia nyererei TaxID=303518 RepID=A0A3B4G1X4_9CICH
LVLFHIFETKTAHVGANIKLTCPRRSMGTLFWIKLVSGNFPKIFGRSFSSQRVDQRIRTATEDGIFDLYITKVQESDTGVYFCVKTLSRDLIFLKGTFLKSKFEIQVKRLFGENNPNTILREKCSILRDFQNKSCPTDKKMFCLSAKSHQSHLDLNYSCVNGEDEYEKNPEELSAKACFYSYFRNFSSFDSQKYYCAVATCVENRKSLHLIIFSFFSQDSVIPNQLPPKPPKLFNTLSKSAERHKKPTEEDSIYAAVKAPALD